MFRNNALRIEQPNSLEPLSYLDGKGQKLASPLRRSRKIPFEKSLLSRFGFPRFAQQQPSSTVVLRFFSNTSSRLSNASNQQKKENFKNLKSMASSFRQAVESQAARPAVSPPKKMENPNSPQKSSVSNPKKIHIDLSKINFALNSEKRGSADKREQMRPQASPANRKGKLGEDHDVDDDDDGADDDSIASEEIENYRDEGIVNSAEEEKEPTSEEGSKEHGDRKQKSSKKPYPSEAPASNTLNDPGKTTPMMYQYFKLKEQTPGYLLLFRMGDFYEMFFEDAVIASKALTIEVCSEAKNCRVE